MHYFLKPGENLADGLSAGLLGLFVGGYHGPAWLTGGPLGIEASWLVFPMIALLFIGFHLATRRSTKNSFFAASPAPR